MLDTTPTAVKGLLQRARAARAQRRPAADVRGATPHSARERELVDASPKPSPTTSTPSSVCSPTRPGWPCRPRRTSTTARRRSPRSCAPAPPGAPAAACVWSPRGQCPARLRLLARRRRRRLQRCDGPDPSRRSDRAHHAVPGPCARSRVRPDHSGAVTSSTSSSDRSSSSAVRRLRMIDRRHAEETDHHEGERREPRERFCVEHVELPEWPQHRHHREQQAEHQRDHVQLMTSHDAPPLCRDRDR